jgi:hypothetical protein
VQPPAGMRWTGVPGHHVRYGRSADAVSDDRFWLWFHCPVCGDVSRKSCYRPELVTRWALYYADDHCHGRVRRAR